MKLTDRFEWSPEKRCPYGTIQDVFGPSVVSRLLDYATERESAFKTGLVRSRRTGELRLDPSVRDSFFLREVGPFRQHIEPVVREIAPLALAQLGLVEPAVEPREFEFACYSDGSYFKTHVDTLERLERVRVLSCVYYFATKPQRFHGGELRLYGFPDPSGRAGGRIVDVVPESDKLVIFPSWLEHEVLPVHVPSKVWRDCRFSINCWIHRIGSHSGVRPESGKQAE